MSLATAKKPKSKTSPAAPAKYPVKPVPLDKITIDADTQMRVRVDDDAVNDYRMKYAEGVDLPPIKVVFDGVTYWPWDGYHRYFARHRNGDATILAEVRPGTRRDAVLLAVGANAEHGLQRSSADKRRAVEALLSDAEWATWSDREIARRATVAPTYVGNVRAQIAAKTDAGASVHGGQMRKYERNGKTVEVDTSKIGNTKPAAADSALPVNRENETAAETPREPEGAGPTHPRDLATPATPADDFSALPVMMTFTLPTQDIPRAASMITTQAGDRWPLYLATAIFDHLQPAAPDPSPDTFIAGKRTCESKPPGGESKDELRDRLLWQALHATVGAAERWAERARNGGDDGMLRAWIADEWKGAPGFSGGPRENYATRGGNHPAIWFDAVVGRGKPDYSGVDLLARVRRIFSIGVGSIGAMSVEQDREEAGDSSGIALIDKLLPAPKKRPKGQDLDWTAWAQTVAAKCRDARMDVAHVPPTDFAVGLYKRGLTPAMAMVEFEQRLGHATATASRKSRKKSKKKMADVGEFVAVAEAEELDLGEGQAIDADVIDVLRNCDLHPLAVSLPATQLDRKLYERVNKVLETLGGKWSKKARAHVFAVDPSPLLAGVVASGRIVDRQKVLAFFETPELLADRVAELADVEAHHSVLEPSAGTGRLVRAVMARCARARVTAVEIDPNHVDALSGICDDVLRGDFLTMDFVKFGGFDRVIANPPFSGRVWQKHVTRMIDLLKPGGRLVCVLPASASVITDANEVLHNRLTDTDDFEEMAFLPVPPGSFKESGTDVNTVILVAQKKVTPGGAS